MQHSLTITVSPSLLKAFNNAGADRNRLIKDELTVYSKDIASLLSGYHWSEKGIVDDLEIDEASIAINEQGTGSFKVKYAINIHFGCSDVDIDLDKSMPVTIVTDIEQQTAKLTGEFIYEREPDF